MSHIANPKTYPTKKSFVEAVNADPSKVQIDDPFIMAPDSGSVAYFMGKKDLITVTNHPKRSWYVQIKRKPDGTIKAT